MALPKDTHTNILRPGTIILVDDDANFRNEMREILEEEEFDVVAVESANHALRHLQSRPWNWTPWLVITDLVMDGMGGYHLLRRLNELYPNKNIPMIVVSRLGSSEDVLEAEMAGAAAYLTKPVEPQKLLETLRKVTTQKKKEVKITMSSKLI
ncbi:MAG: response regulator [Deltaproteobacteria bacterium]|nr:response regulator [Deltaproteobacteria bacterium]